MAEKKKPKRIRSEEQKWKKKFYDQARAKSRVNIGEAFQQWRDLREEQGMKTDAEVAQFLLERCETSALISNHSPTDRLLLPPSSCC